MTYDELLHAAEERAGLAGGDAERTTLAVLQALCDRLTGDEAFDLLAQLPAQLKKSITLTQLPMGMTTDEFVERIARELDVEPGEARNRIRAVFGVTREAVTGGEFEDVIAQLDPEYADLLA